MAKKEVTTVFKLLDHASHAAHKMAEGMEKLHKAAERAKQKVEGVIAPKLAALGLAIGFGEMAHKMYELGEAAEESKRALSGVYILSGRFNELEPGEAAAKSMEVAEKVFSRFEETSMKKGIASVEQYSDVFKRLGSITATTFASSEEMAGVTEQLVAGAKQMGLGYETAAAEVQSLSNILTTGVGKPNKELLKMLHIQKKEWEHIKKLAPDKMWQEVVKHANKAKKDLDFKGPGIQIEKIRATAAHFMRVLGEPMMEELGKEAEKLAKWLTENKDQAKELARQFADKVVKGIHFAVAGAKFLASHWKTILPGLMLIMGAPTAISAGIGVAKVAKGFMSVTAGAFKLAERLGLIDAHGPALQTALSALGKAAGVLAVGFAAFELASWLDKKFDMSGKIAKFTAKTTGEEKFRAEYEAMGVAQQRVLEKKIAEARMQRVAELEKKGYKHGQALAAVQHHLTLAEIKKNAAASRHHNKKMSRAEALVAAGEMADKHKLDKATNTFDFRGSKFDIKQAFAEGFDPDRIAVAFTNDLATMGERRLQSAHSPIYGAR